MAFWGVEVKPGETFMHGPDKKRRRLHISQATLGNLQVTSSTDRAASDRVVVGCEVGSFGQFFVYSLLPQQVECCQLNLEFEETPFYVFFSVIGNQSVHLTGYYLSGTGTSPSNQIVDVESESHEEDKIPVSSPDKSPAEQMG